MGLRFDSRSDKRAMREMQKRACEGSGGKVRFRSRKQALTALNHSRSMSSRTVKANGVYKCSICGDWHFTSKARATR